MLRYEVNLYNKDDDNYLNIYKGDDLQTAKSIQKIVNNLATADYIVDKEFNREPFDWCEIYDTILKEVINA